MARPPQYTPPSPWTSLQCLYREKEVTIQLKEAPDGKVSHLESSLQQRFIPLIGNQLSRWLHLATGGMFFLATLSLSGITE